MGSRRIAWENIAATVALLWLAIAVPAMELYSRHEVDFPQYYMGGAIAIRGDWSSLYPIPRPDSPRNPGNPADSDMLPGYARLARDLHVGDRVRFIQPPPAALFYAPLALLPYPVARVTWIVFISWALVGLSWRLRQITLLVCPDGKMVAGVAMLAFAVSPLSRWAVRVGNVSPVVALCIVEVLLAEIHGRRCRLAASLVLGAVLKYATLPLTLVLVRRERWVDLGFAAVAGCLLALTSLFTMGRAPFAAFLADIVPTLGRSINRPGNQSLHGLLLRTAQADVLPDAWAVALQAGKWLGISLVLSLVIARLRRTSPPIHLFAAGILLIGWMLLFSPIVWSHYLLYAVPFWGVLLLCYRVSYWLAALSAAAILMHVLPCRNDLGLSGPWWLVDLGPFGTLLMAIVAGYLLCSSPKAFETPEP